MLVYPRFNRYFTFITKENTPLFSYLQFLLECAKLGSSRDFVPYVSHLPTCLTCLRTFVPCFLRASLFYVPNVPSYFYVPYCLTCPHCFTCLTCLYFLRALSAFIFYLPYMPSFFKVFPIFDVPYVTSKFLSQKNPGQYRRITLD